MCSSLVLSPPACTPWPGCVQRAETLITARPVVSALNDTVACFVLPDRGDRLKTMTQGTSVEQASCKISSEELVNSCTHGVGLGLSIAGFLVC